MITTPELPPKAGYVEVEENGKRVYKKAKTAQSDFWSELDAAYQEGVNTAYDS